MLIENPLDKIDDFLIEKFERQAHKFQRLTGKDCFWLAELFLYIAAGLMISTNFYSAEVSPQPHLALLCGMSFILFLSAYLSLLVTKRQFEVNPKFKNQERLNKWSRIIRKLYVTMILLNGIIISGDLQCSPYTVYVFSFCLYGVFYYLLACTPLPPGTSMLKKVLNKIREAFTLSPTALPDPIPS